ncbi:MAG: RDD family protein [Chloroflexi bacterium]|nr:RDD family protein [Chloroflexota bacterium]
MQRWADDRYLIDTPERVDLEYEIAGLGSRFLAALIDSIVLGFATGVVMFAAVVGLAIELRFVERDAGRDFNNTAPFVLISIEIVLFLLVLLGY